MKGDLLRLHLTILDFDLITAKNNGNVFTNTCQVTVPIGYILVRNSRSYIEHDNGALSLDVVPITKTTKFLIHTEQRKTTEENKCQMFKDDNVNDGAFRALIIQILQNVTKEEKKGRIDMQHLFAF